MQSKRVRLLLVILGFLPLLACSERADPEAADPERVPDIGLPVVDLVQEYPPPEMRLVVNLPASLEISVEGRGLDFEGFRMLLRDRASAYREPDDLRSSRLDVVFRADREVTWGEASDLLRACADPDVRADRTWFAAVDGDGREGVVRAFLPVTMPGRGRFMDELPLYIESGGEGATVEDLPGLLESMRSQWPEKPFEVSISCHPAVGMGTFVRVLRVLQRLDPGEVTFRAPTGTHEPVVGPVTPRVRFGRPGGSGSRWLESLEDGKAVREGLEWLKDRQNSVGSWDGGGVHDVGVTGLAVLAFTGAGETHKNGAYRKTVRDGLKYLKQNQDAEGCFGPRKADRWIYDHAIATLAMCEAYRLTRSPLFKQSGQQAIDFAEKCRNPGLAWRYGIRPGENDTSVTAWMALDLASGKASGLRVPEEAFAGIRAWIGSVTDPTTGAVGYRTAGSGAERPSDRLAAFPSFRSEAPTAMGIHSLLLAGEGAASDGVAGGVYLCRQNPPAWDAQAGSIDMAYWLFGTLALDRVEGRAWQEWADSLKPAVFGTQRTEPVSLRGSWDPAGVWGREGGRVYATAVMLLCAEIYHDSPTVVGAWE